MPTRYFTGLLSLSLSLCAGLLVAQSVYQDKPFPQLYSVKYYAEKTAGSFMSLACDRNGLIQILAADGLHHPFGGQFLYPGTLPADRTYRPMQNRKLAAIGSYDQQLVYLDDQAVLSNAWAGRLYVLHQLPQARLFVGGAAFTFLVSDGKALHLVGESGVAWKGALPNDEVIGLRFQSATGQFWILGRQGLYTLSAQNHTLTNVLHGDSFTCFDLTSQQKKVVIGTDDGYLEFDPLTKTRQGAVQRKLPWTKITAVADVEGKLWVGSTRGAFSRRADGTFDYFNGKRWLPGDTVRQIMAGPRHSVLVLTTAGMASLVTKSMTLYDKAVFYEEQVRSRHIRNGFNASLDGLQKGDLSTGYLADSDNDGLWTSMYLAAEVFRYAVTKDQDALQNCRESLDAMERLYTINPVPGFPARSFERAGYIARLSDPERWQHSPQPGWDWKSTTSSDEIIGHIFAFGVMAELVNDKPLQRRAITLIDTVMSHILNHDLYLIDFDGKPTMWGKWNPAYVNAFPTNVGDRKLNSSNIIAMLQTAYYFTKKEKYRRKAFELMQKHGYLENLMRPMNRIGKASDDADEHSKKMSDAWNHSDDEMYFVGYWGLYRYAFNDTLKTNYKKAILDHWEMERPEKDGAWNIFTALTGTETFDLPEAVWFLKEHPLDLIDWEIYNSHRKDIELLTDNFRGQTTKEVLSPAERPIQRHNGNTFRLDRTQGDGASEYSAGDIWLLPYWMGRYLGVIRPPADSLTYYRKQLTDYHKMGVSAHRGASDVAPENTLATFRLALGMQVDYIEIDIRTTKDGQLVILHDGTLNRTTSGTGPVKDYTLADLKKLSAAKGMPASFAEETIPTLEEVCQLLADWNARHPSKTNLYVDCKEVAPEPMVALLNRYGLLTDAVFYGSDEKLLALRQAAPNARLMPSLKNADDLAAKVARLHPYAFDVSWPALTEALVARIHEQHIRVFSDLLDAYDTPGQYEKAARLGIDVIQTDHVMSVYRTLAIPNK